MSRIAQEMQRIADEMAAARRAPKKGRKAVDETKLEDVTAGEPAAAAQEAPPAAAAQQEQTMAKTGRAAKKAGRKKSESAVRSAKWREKKKREAGAPAAAGDKASVKAESGGGKIKGGRTVFLTVPLALAQEAFTMLLDSTESRRTQAADTDAEAALTEKATSLQKIVSRLA